MTLESPIRKRSVRLYGHRTSLSVEDAFWDKVNEIAERDGKSITVLVTEIDKARGAKQNMSSAVRLFVLNDLKARLAAGAAALVFGWLAFAPPAEAAEPLRVIDGDTIVLKGERIRLAHIDAPEVDQTCTGKDGQEWRCGEVAKVALSHMTEGRKVICLPLDKDRYGRTVAVCAAAGIGDLGSAMVRTGYALAAGGYQRLQEEAAARGDGIWEGSFQAPALYRKTKVGK